VALVAALPPLAMITWFWADGSASGWEPTILGAWWLYMLLVFPLSIRRVERRSAAGVPPPDVTTAKKLRIAVWAAAWGVGLPALTGYLIGGATLAAIFGGGAAAYLGVLVLFIRRRQKRRAASAGTP